MSRGRLDRSECHSGYFEDLGARGQDNAGLQTQSMNVKKRSEARETTLRPQTRKVALACGAVRTRDLDAHTYSAMSIRAAAEPGVRRTHRRYYGHRIRRSPGLCVWCLILVLLHQEAKRAQHRTQASVTQRMIPAPEQFRPQPDLKLHFARKPISHTPSAALPYPSAIAQPLALGL